MLAFIVNMTASFMVYIIANEAVDWFLELLPQAWFPSLVWYQLVTFLPIFLFMNGLSRLDDVGLRLRPSTVFAVFLALYFVTPHEGGRADMTKSVIALIVIFAGEFASCSECEDYTLLRSRPQKRR